MTRHPEIPGRTNLGLWSLSLAYFSMGTSSIAVVGLVNNMAADLGVSKPDVAVLITVFALTFALAAPLLQVAAGSLQRRTLLLGGLVVLATGCLLSAIAPSYAGVVAARVLMALGAAAVGPVASGLGAGLVPPERQGQALAVVFGGMTLTSSAIVSAVSRLIAASPPNIQRQPSIVPSQA
ncbi:MAG: MFS transporter, partial [Betaproteobacteria bacterium]|nr:MFS transporter [Betaproteobacteria bacterium]